MRNTINLIVGAFAVFTVVYKIATCPSCPDRFFGFEVPGIVYILIWTAAAISIFYPAYKRMQAEKKLK